LPILGGFPKKFEVFEEVELERITGIQGYFEMGEKQVLWKWLVAGEIRNFSVFRKREIRQKKRQEGIGYSLISASLSPPPEPRIPLPAPRSPQMKPLKFPAPLFALRAFFSSYGPRNPGVA